MENSNLITKIDRKMHINVAICLWERKKERKKDSGDDIPLFTVCSSEMKNLVSFDYFHLYPPTNMCIPLLNNHLHS